MTPIALTIAGSDPSGGAGIQADLKTFHQFGVYGTSVVTLLTVQNTCRGGAIESLRPDFVLAQLDAVLDDLPPRAAKTGALGTREVVEALATRAASFSFPLVVDPVMISKHGAQLLHDKEARSAVAYRLLPHAFLVTPNVPEAIALSGIEIRGMESAEEASRAIAGLGVKVVLITGIDFESRPESQSPSQSIDLLYAEGRFHRFAAKRIETRHTHGTGCTLSAAITAGLAKGDGLVDAVSTAKQFVTRAIETNPGLGRGNGPLNHWAAT